MQAYAGLPLWFVVLSAIVLGLIVGSFLNVVILRLPRMLEARWAAEAAAADASDLADTTPVSLAAPASHCPHCRTPIKAWHNVPLLGYLGLRGRCAACGHRISALYPLVEAAAAAIACLVLYRFGLTPAGGTALLASWLLLALAVIDARTQLLPDVLTLSLLWLGLLASVIGIGPATAVSPADAIIGAAAGYGVLWLVFTAFKCLTGKHGMGHGDFKLLAALGAWLGWQQLPLVLLMASLGGSLIGIALMATGRLDRGTPMPFGPWLAGAGWLALIAGDTIMAAYLTLSGLR
ncbi:A24 family peptidase [Salinisphaera sp. Q1T1-3]|uniref:prepilin peptidase n=1 Tax=Salinisphaera sp. Q1T1-3 TaxID=2321229 RepID=UPI000E72593A|nr:A24 family peptidase [Salinisphaera sp. Q1T1-3]RJS92199.1 prepilin peptidase [Salinisphaera sp. Q1T1-3]